MLELYATLLSVNVTLLSLFLAFILVYLEIATSQYSYRITPIVLRGFPFRFFIGITTITLGISGLSLYILSASPFDFVQGINLGIIEIVRHPFTGLLAVVLSLLDGAIFFYLLFHYSKYLQATVVAREIAAQIKDTELINFLYLKYGIPDEPLDIEIHVHFADLSDAELEQLLEENDPKKSVDIIHFQENPVIQAKSINQRDKLRKHLQSQSQFIADPLAPLIEVAAFALGKHDLSAWNYALWQIEKTIRRFIRSERLLSSEPSSHDLQKGLPSLFIDYLSG